MELNLEKPGGWISLLEYAIKKGISLSTLRRHIKANKILYRIEQGRYLLWHEETNPTTDLQLKLSKLEKELQEAREEIAELKMLIALYEEKIPNHE